MELKLTQLKFDFDAHLPAVIHWPRKPGLTWIEHWAWKAYVAEGRIVAAAMVTCRSRWVASPPADLPVWKTAVVEVGGEPEAGSWRSVTLDMAANYGWFINSWGPRWEPAPVNMISFKWKT